MGLKTVVFERRLSFGGGIGGGGMLFHKIVVHYSDVPKNETVKVLYTSILIIRNLCIFMLNRLVGRL